MIATAGSCFAQHIGRALKVRGYDWHDSEPAPLLMCRNKEKCELFNYGIFSFRTGNIYTVTLLKHLQESPVSIYVEHIRKYTESPIIISISPRLSILAIEKQPELYQHYLKQADYFEHLFVYARQQVFKYPNITFLDQPKDTLADEALGFTKYEYLNSYGKIKPENTQDLGHKNPKYGKLVLAKIMEQLQAFDF